MKSIILLASICLLSACSELPDARDCSIPRDGQTRLVAFGDSQTQGVASAVGFCQFSYAYVMAESLSLNLLNRAIGGTRLMVAGQTGPSQYDMVMETTFEPTDVVIFQPGFNDIAAMGTDDDALVVFEAMLTDLIALVSAQTSHVYLVTPLTMLSYRGTNGSPEAHGLYSQAIRNAAAGFANVTVIETNELFTLGAYDVFDGIHIGPTAQERLANAYLDFLGISP